MSFYIQSAKTVLYSYSSISILNKQQFQRASCVIFFVLVISLSELDISSNSAVVKVSAKRNPVADWCHTSQLQ